MANYHLAQLNIAHSKAPMDSPLLADFVNNLDRINALADEAPGFVWRLQSDEGNALDFRIYDDRTLVNMSVWEDVESLKEYVYKTAHVEIMRRRKEWFHLMDEVYMVLWWIPAGHIPTLDEAAQKLDLLKEKGATADAFTFKQAFPMPD